MNDTTYKIALIGPGAVGKTTWLTKIKNGNFIQKYVPTLGVDVREVKLTVALGSGEPSTVTFEIWDCAGQEKNAGLHDGYYIQSHGAIVMYDLTSRLSYKNHGRYIGDFTRVNPNAPYVVCGSKYDVISGIKIKNPLPEHVLFSNRKGIDQYQPLTQLLEKITGESVEIIL